MLDKSELPTEQEDAHDALSIMVDKKFDHIYNLFEMKTHCVVTCTICHHVVVSPNEYQWCFSVPVASSIENSLENYFSF